MIVDAKGFRSPKISVLIPVYNREDLLRQAVESVLQQEYENLEIIISDNCSTDATLSVAREFASIDSRVRVFKNDTNVGPVANWKACLKRASGEYVHWLWSDDWIEEGFYSDAVRLMRAKRTNVLTTWNYRTSGLEKDSDRYISWSYEHEEISGKAAAQKILAVTNELPLSPAAWILPAESVRRGFFDEIPDVGRFHPVEKGVGVDSLMIVESVVSADVVAVLRKPSVTFRSHDNISNSLSASGELSLLYSLAHIWYATRFRPELTFKNAVRLFLRAGKGLFRCKGDKYLVAKGILGMIFLINVKSIGFVDPYSSRRVKFKK